ncbi:unnamed protein product [Spirodela intermedia]|uniref:RNA polymerase II subunit B1 CTD phosphatase RPAP2 homolog n=1 Tax=Spirodela intermedia TaxID=51605 RepID=A0A7I8KM55_SPIIN|nr:unnamed protein product [Spirodela intermedia]
MAKAEEGRERKLTSVVSAIHKLQLSLLEDGPCSELQLFAAGALLSCADYEDVVVERSIAGLCGYPPCPNPLPPDRSRRGRYRISLSEHKVYDLEETYKFCSETCVVNSRAFSGSLQPDRCSPAGLGKVAEVLRLFESLPAEEGAAGLGGGRRSAAAAADGDLGFSNLTIHEKTGLVAGEVPGEEWIGPSNAIEGYVPQRDRKNEALLCGRTIEPSSLLAGADSRHTASTERRTKTKTDAAKGDYADAEIGGPDFTSTIILGSPHPSSSSRPSATSCGAAQGVNSGELDRTEEKVKKPPALKSSLKTSRSKVGRSCSVKWADKTEVKTFVETEPSAVEREFRTQRTGSSRPSNDEIDDSSLRLDSAEACTVALVQLADSISSGEQESGDAASRAGIVLLPPPNHAEQRNSNEPEEEDSFEFDNGTVKWPKKTVLLDTDFFEVEDSWHDTPPEGFNLTLSPFATMWNALFGWLTCSSLAFIYGTDEDAPQDEFLCVDGREYPSKVALKDGRSSEIKQTMAACIARALPPLATDLHLRIPVSSIEKAMGRLVETMSFVDALPPFKMKQWSVITLLFVDALSVHRIPAVAPQVSGSRFLLQKILSAAQVTAAEYESMQDLILPLGRVP